MNMWRVFYQSLFTPLRVFNRNSSKEKLTASTVVFLLTALLGTVVLPITYYAVNRNGYMLSFEVGSMLVAFCVSVLSWLTVCLLFWALSRAFRNGLRFRDAVSVWGLSYIPNLGCVLLYGLLQNVPGMQISSGFAAFIVSALFILLLVWKAIYYFMFLRFVMDVTLKEFLITFFSSAIVFAGLIYVGAIAGIQVPML